MSMPSLTLEREELTTVVCRATDTPAAQVVNWQINQLTGGCETVSRIYAVDGFDITIEQLPPRVNRWVEFGIDYANLARKIRVVP